MELDSLNMYGLMKGKIDRSPLWNFHAVTIMNLQFQSDYTISSGSVGDSWWFWVDHIHNISDS